MKPGKGVLFVTQNLPVEMSRLQVLSDFISTEMAWDYSVFCLGRTLPRGDVEIWLHPEVVQHGNELNFSNGLRLCRLSNCFIISSVMSSLEFVDTTKEGPQNLQRLWNWSLTLSTQPVATTIDVTFTAGSVVFDVLPSLSNVRISVTFARL